VAISAKLGDGVPELLGEISSALRPIREFVELRIHMTNPRSWRVFTKWAQVIERDYKGKSARFKARIPPHLRREFEPFMNRNCRSRSRTEGRVALHWE